MKNKIITVVILSLFILTSFSTVFAHEGLGNIIFQEDTYLGPNIFYENQMAIHPVNNLEHGYTIDIRSTDGAIEPYIFNGSVTGGYTLSNMVKMIKQEGYTVIAGVNGDFFDTKTKVPLGMTIHDGKIKTSGSNSGYSLAFKNDGRAFVGNTSIGYNLTVNNDTGKKAAIGYFNQTQGAAKALHLYNSQFASTTKTVVNNVEVVANVAGDDEPKVGGNITATVSAVINNSKNAPIGSGQIVLSSVSDGAYATFLSELVVGDQLTIEIEDKTPGNQWSEVREAVGAYDLIALDGKVTAKSNAALPRTAIGIKSDGSIMMFVVDGKQAGHSKGMGLQDVAKYLLSRGCVHVVNLDGGGSSTVNVRLPGDYDAVRVNKPSDKSERSVSNGLFLVTTQKGSGVAENLHIYPMTKLMMPGSSYSYTSVKATDSMYAPVSVPSYSFSLENENIGTITNNGIFTAGSEPGEGVVKVSSGNAIGMAKIRVIKNADIAFNEASFTIKPGESKNLNAQASYYGLPVDCKNSLFKWSCDPQIGRVTQEGVFTALNNGGNKGNIYLEYNGIKKALYVEVMQGASSVPTPPVTEQGTKFTDVKDSHWASLYINQLAEKGIINGMGGGKYLPESPVTRAQFVKILAGGLNGVDVKSAKATGFTDLKAGEWYIPYVNWAFEKGIVSGLTATEFAPDSPITREQMAIMLNNFSKHANIELESNVGNASFSDSSKINFWSKDSVELMVKSGLMNGRPDGTFDPQGKATRAESAKVIYVLLEIGNN